MKSAKAVVMEHSAATVGRVERDLETLKRPDVALDEAACEYLQAHPDVGYAAALEAVMQEKPTLAHEFSESFVTRKTVAQHSDLEDEDASSVAAGKQLDEIAQAWLREHPAEQHDYAKALQIAMDSHPDLAMLWKKSFNKAL